MREKEAEREELLEATVQAALKPRRGGRAADAAHRSGVLRRADGARLAGVCAALGRAIGVPVRLLRVLALLLTALGVGPALYLVAMLFMPRIERAPDGTERDEVEWPLRATASGRPRLSDVIALLAVVPSMLLGLVWPLILQEYLPSMLALLAGVSVLLLLLTLRAARRAAQARRALVMAVLAREAGLRTAEDLTDFVEEHHRRAPHAWTLVGSGDVPGALAPQTAVTESAQPTGEGDGDTSPSSASTPAGAAAPARPARARSGTRPARAARPTHRPTLSVRTVLAVLAGAFAMFAAVLVVLNGDPDVAPAIAHTPLLPQIGRIGAAAGMATLVLALAVVIAGLRGRRTAVLPALACIGLLVAAGGAVWLRLTWDPLAQPQVITVSEPKYGSEYSCPSTPDTWNQPIVIDMRSVTAQDAKRLRAQAEARGDSDGGVYVYVGCSVPVGRLTILMPKDPSLVQGGIATAPDYEPVGDGGPEAVISVHGSIMVSELLVIDYEAAGNEPAEQWASGGDLLGRRGSMGTSGRTGLVGSTREADGAEETAE